jgi:hypothetical protein
MRSRGSASRKKLIFSRTAGQRLISYSERRPFVALKPRMPRGLGTEGKKLWEGVIGEFSLGAEPHKLRILFDACTTADVVKRLDDAARSAPLTVKGSAGQQVINPLVAQAQVAKGQLAQLLGRLNFAPPEDF